MVGQRRWARVGAIAVVATFTLAGCGGGSGGASAPADSDGTESPVGGGDTGDGGDADLGDISDDCARTGAAFTKALESFDALDEFASGGSIEIDVDALRADIESARDAVPSDIRGAYDTYMDAFLEYAELMDGISPEDYTDPDVLGRLSAAAAAFSAPEMSEAMTDLTQYLTQECGLADLGG